MGVTQAGVVPKLFPPGLVGTRALRPLAGFLVVADPGPQPDEPHLPEPRPDPTPPGGQQLMPMSHKAILRLTGTVPRESWNMVGIKILSQLRPGDGMNLAVDLSFEVDSERLKSPAAGPDADRHQLRTRAGT